MKKDLLIEIGTEELPPKALKTLSDAFSQGIVDGLKHANLECGEWTSFATPRRLAILIKDVAKQQPDQITERRGPALQAAFDADGNPSKAIIGFAKSCGVNIAQLSKLETDKGSWFVFEQQQKGKQTIELLSDIVSHSLAKLPSPKRMRWGDRDAEFVRPAHWLLAIFGDDVVDMKIMDLQAGRITRGHRFHHSEPLTIDMPGSYETQLQACHVIPNFEERRASVKEAALSAAQSLGGSVVIDPDLLDEVTALVEWPVAVVGGFEERYLDVPQECLITTMEDNQKYFAVVNADGKLMPHFITTSNIESKDVSKVREGNERVIRPRFSDAEFFWQQDKKSPLATRIEATKNILFQQQLGTLFEKSARVAELAGYIAEKTGANTTDAKRAAELSKCDLMTDMVGEFPKLQGTMGRYYALNDGENNNVANALEEQYKPRYAGDSLPESEAGLILSLADKIDTLMGIFAIGQRPTGAKDPFALRRAALGALRIIIEARLDLDLKELFNVAAQQLASKVDASSKVDETFDYVLERLNAYYADQGIPAGVIDSVAKLRPNPLDFDERVRAVSSFRNMPEAESLAVANKRISNILKKQNEDIAGTVDESLLLEEQEATLYRQLIDKEALVTPMFDQGNYEEALKTLAGLRDSVDAFFDHVMVMADDNALQNNRLAILNKLRNIFLRVADLSVLH